MISALVEVLFPAAVCLKKLGCQDCIDMSFMIDQCICSDALSTCNLSQAHKQYKAMQRATLIIQCYARGWKVSDLSTFTLHRPPCSSLPILHFHLINVQRSLSFDFGGELVSRCFSFVSRSVQIVYIIASVIQDSLLWSC